MAGGTDRMRKLRPKGTEDDNENDNENEDEKGYQK